MQLYAYPLRDCATGQVKTVENIEMPSALHNLFRHLVEGGRIKHLNNFDESVLHIFSREVLKKIKENDVSWEEMVPLQVAEMVKQRKLFGYRDPQGLEDASFVPRDEEGASLHLPR